MSENTSYFAPNVSPSSSNVLTIDLADITPGAIAPEIPVENLLIPLVADTVTNVNFSTMPPRAHRWNTELPEGTADGSQVPTWTYRLQEPPLERLHHELSDARLTRQESANPPALADGRSTGGVSLRDMTRETVFVINSKPELMSDTRLSETFQGFLATSTGDFGAEPGIKTFRVGVTEQAGPLKGVQLPARMHAEHELQLESLHASGVRPGEATWQELLTPTTEINDTTPNANASVRDRIQDAVLKRSVQLHTWLTERLLGRTEGQEANKLRKVVGYAGALATMGVTGAVVLKHGVSLPNIGGNGHAHTATEALNAHAGGAHVDAVAHAANAHAQSGVSAGHEQAIIHNHGVSAHNHAQHVPVQGHETASAHAGTNNSLQSDEIRLHANPKSDSIWENNEIWLRSHGYKTTDSNVATLTNRMIHHYHITQPGKLQVGWHHNITPDMLKDLEEIDD